MAGATIVQRGLASARTGIRSVMNGGLGTIVYVVIGAFVAAANNYFSHVGTIEGVASAVIAILLWPLILIGIDIRIT
jgi:hypothetical protein